MRFISYSTYNTLIYYFSIYFYLDNLFTNRCIQAYYTKEVVLYT
jgi:hypothetical protein